MDVLKLPFTPVPFAFRWFVSPVLSAEATLVTLTEVRKALSIFKLVGLAVPLALTGCLQVIVMLTCGVFLFRAIFEGLNVRIGGWPLEPHCPCVDAYGIRVQNINNTIQLSAWSIIFCSHRRASLTAQIDGRCSVKVSTVQGPILGVQLSSNSRFLFLYCVCPVTVTKAFGIVWSGHVPSAKSAQLLHLWSFSHEISDAANWFAWIANYCSFLASVRFLFKQHWSAVLDEPPFWYSINMHPVSQNSLTRNRRQISLKWAEPLAEMKTIPWFACLKIEEVEVLSAAYKLKIMIN